jgi:hypothetical protein
VFYQAFAVPQWIFNKNNWLLQLHGIRYEYRCTFVARETKCLHHGRANRDGVSAVVADE